MNKLIFVSLLMVVTGFVTPVYAETDHSHNSKDEHSHNAANTATADNRIAVKLPAKAKLTILKDMRNHLEIVQSIVSALAKEDFEMVAEFASKLGHMEHSDEVMKRRKMMPEGYRTLGPQMHMGFQAIARDARDFGDVGQTLEQLSSTMNLCTSCHQTYRLEATHDSLD